MAMTSVESVEDPPQSQFDKVLTGFFWIGVCIYATVTGVSSLAAPVGKFDDAIPLLHGTLIQQGYTPNLDFYSFYPPLNLYLNAVVFSLLGRSVIAVRAVAELFYVGVLLLTAWFFSSRSSGSLVATAVLLVAASIGDLTTMPAWTGFCLSLAALLTYLSSQSLQRYRLWVVAGSGVLGGLALLCRINFGGYAAAVVVLDLVLQRWLDVGDTDGVSSRREMATMAAFATPLVVCFAGLCLAIYGENIAIGVSEFIVTAQKLMALRGFISLRFDADVACAVVLPPFWFLFRLLKGSQVFPTKAWVPTAIGMAVLMVALVGRAHFSIALIVVALEIGSVILLHVFVYRLERGELSFLLFFCCMLHYFLSRADWDHWRILPVGASLLLALHVIANYEPSRARFEPTTAKGTALAVMTAAIFLFATSAEFRPGFSWLPTGVALLKDLVRHPRSADTDRLLGPRVAPEWTSVYPDKEELDALRYVRERTSPSTAIFVGAQDHSTIFWNDLRMYWLAGRPIGVKTFQLETRIATESLVQREIVADLERNDVRWIILDRSRDGDAAFKQAAYKGSELLDHYIADHYREETRFGRYMILTRLST